MADLGATSLRWSIVLIDFDPTKGHEQAGTRRALVVSYVIPVHQVRTVDLTRVTAWQLQGHRQFVTDNSVRCAVRLALLAHFGLDLPASADGADLA